MADDRPALGPYEPAGAVLASHEIQWLCEQHKPALMTNFDPDCLKPAAYDLRIASDGLIMPDQRLFKPGNHHRGAVVLRPGETAFVSTLEQLTLPEWLAGNICIKGDFARQGVLLMTGLVVDPHYGPGSTGDGRLHFTLANLGGETIAIQPGHTRVVTVQFVRTSGHPKRLGATSVSNLWSRKDLTDIRPLGFIEELREVQETVRGVETRLERQGRLTEYALIAGLFLLAITILAASFTALLTAATDAKVVREVQQAIPDKAGERVFLMVLALSVAWIVHSLCAGLVRGSRPPPKAERASDYQRRQAIRSLGIERAGRRALVGAVLLWAATAVVWIALQVQDIDGWWPIIPAVVGLLLIACGFVLQRTWRPLREPYIRQRMEELYTQEDQGGW